MQRQQMQPQHPRAPWQQQTGHSTNLGSEIGVISSCSLIPAAGRAGGHSQCSAHCRLTLIIPELILQGIGEDYPGKLGKFGA